MVYILIILKRFILGSVSGTPTIIKNIRGFLSDSNIEDGSFPYSLDPKLSTEGTIMYGAGASLIDVSYSENEFASIALQNILMDGLYFTVGPESTY